MDKNIIKETMLSLEGAALQSACEKYFDYVADARLDRSEPIESDEQAQAEIASDLSEALDDTPHAYQNGTMRCFVYADDWRRIGDSLRRWCYRPRLYRGRHLTRHRKRKLCFM